MVKSIDDDACNYNGKQFYGVREHASMRIELNEFEHITGTKVTIKCEITKQEDWHKGARDTDTSHQSWS